MLEEHLSALVVSEPASDAAFRSMIDALPAAIYTTDAEGRLTHFNPAAVKLSGRVPELATDRWCISLRLYWPDGTPMAHDQCPMATALKEDRRIRGAEAIAERPDGTRVWFAAYPTPLHDRNGNLIGGINMLVDITEPKHTELLLREQSRLLELIASGAPLEACLGAVCASVPQLTTGARAAVLVRNDDDGIARFVAPDLPEAFRERARGAISATAAIWCRDLDCADAPPAWRDLCIEHGIKACYAMPMPGTAGEPFGSFMMCLDDAREPTDWELRLAEFGAHVASIAVERDRATAALRDSKERLRLALADQVRARTDAEAAVHAREEFLSIASHELRNPIAALHGTTQLMRRGLDRGRLDPHRLSRYASVLESTSARLARMTDDLLDVSRLQHGRLPLRRERCDIGALVGDLLGRDPWSEHGIVLAEGASSTSAEVDPDRIEQIVANLLDNAVKYSPHGPRIEVAVATDEAWVVISVRDEGIGFREGEAKEIFTPFGRSRNATHDGIPGLGLGLYLSRELARRHGGDLVASSPGPGRGTTMSLRLPLAGNAARVDA